MEDRKKVFIVDDDLISQELIKMHLNELENIDILAYSDAESCLDNLGLAPDLIILDLNLCHRLSNQINGHEALTYIQQINPNIQVILISGKQNEGILESYHKFRNVDFVVKNEFGLRVLPFKVSFQLKAS